MYEIENALDELGVALDRLESCIDSAAISAFPGDELVKRISILTNREVGLRDRILREYSKDEPKWADEGYKSASQALSYLTHNSSFEMKKVLNRAEFLDSFPFIEQSIKSGEVCLDHIDVLVQFHNDDFYREDLASSIELLVENAKVLPAQRFRLAMKHWKYIVQEVRDNSAYNLRAFNERRFSMWQNEVGNWTLEGVLDPISGEMLNKTIESIRNKIWNEHTKEQRAHYDSEQANADALGYLAKGFIAHDFDAVPLENAIDGEGSDDLEKSFSYKPALTADITIDLENLSTNPSIKDFLQDSLTNKTPLGRAHSHQLVKQILCDSDVSFPLKTSAGFENLGRRVRIAPIRMKKQLALLQNQCEVQGCGVPARWCDAHHIRHWIHGGETKIENLVLLCNRHHTMVHNDKIFEEKLSAVIARKRKVKTKLTVENYVYESAVDTG